MNELVLTESKELTCGPFRLTTTALMVSGEPSFDEWLEAGKSLQKADGAIHWWIGDWLRHGHGRYEHGQYEEALEMLPFEKDTLRADKLVAESFAKSVRRRTDLSWSHHREVMALPEREQDRWLNKAEKNGWSRDKLRKEMRDKENDEFAWKTKSFGRVFIEELNATVDIIHKLTNKPALEISIRDVKLAVKNLRETVSRMLE